jgi:hypothetical protein
MPGGQLQGANSCTFLGKILPQLTVQPENTTSLLYITSHEAASSSVTLAREGPTPKVHLDEVLPTFCSWHSGRITAPCYITCLLGLVSNLDQWSLVKDDVVLVQGLQQLLHVVRPAGHSRAHGGASQRWTSTQFAPHSGPVIHCIVQCIQNTKHA